MLLLSLVESCHVAELHLPAAAVKAQLVGMLTIPKEETVTGFGC